MRKQPRILLIDNFDSFTFNLFHYLEPLVCIDVKRYDLLSETNIHLYDGVVISPGPGLPSDYPLIHDLILSSGHKKNILGVCLGHQAIVEAFNGKLKNLPQVLHGIQLTSHITDFEEPIFFSLPPKFATGHYHSWVADKKELPECLNVTAVDQNGHIMGISHKIFPIKGVQFHPESVMTTFGKTILQNWVKLF